MKNARIVRLCFFVLVLILVCAGTSSAQLFPGRVTGVVRDTQGAAIPDASVKLSNPATGLERTETTDANGEFNFPDLALGSYRLTISKNGFQTSFFNAFNHPNFAEPSPDITTHITATADDGSFDSHFGVGGPRNIQFMLKFSF